LNEIRKGLREFIGMLADGGRLAVVSFHGLEDGLVKREMKAANMTPLTKRLIRPDSAEVQSNPRSRSAVLRAAIATLPAS
jgi:16S rRNA (cytosine1402-N4)-methyltransferase